jgi:hypothetical protein
VAARWVVALFVAAVAVAAGEPVATAAASGAATADCADWSSEPVPGSAAWDEADRDNLRCAAEGRRLIVESPAVTAATEANAAAGAGDFVGDPFRAPHRWAPERGTYEQVT